MGKHEDRYNKRANSIQLWKDKASDLGKSAMALIKLGINGGISFGNRTPLMLMGMSLEALIKGYIISEGIIKVETGKLPIELKEHSLSELYDLAEITLTKDYEEKEFIKRLSEQIEWMGRYPVPTNSYVLQNTKNGPQKSWIFNEKDHEFFKEMYEALYNKIENAS